MAEPLLFLVSPLVEVAGYVIFLKSMALVMAGFTALAFEIMVVLMLAKGLLILGESDKIYFVCITALEFLIGFSCFAEPSSCPWGISFCR